MREIFNKFYAKPAGKVPRLSGEQDVFLSTKTILPFAPIVATGWFRCGTCFTFQVMIFKKYAKKKN